MEKRLSQRCPKGHVFVFHEIIPKGGRTLEARAWSGFIDERGETRGVRWVIENITAGPVAYEVKIFCKKKTVEIRSGGNKYIAKLPRIRIVTQPPILIRGFQFEVVEAPCGVIFETLREFQLAV